jgi:hypothetical protein
MVTDPPAAKTVEVNPHPSLLMRRADIDEGVIASNIEAVEVIANSGYPAVEQDYGTPWDELPIPSLGPDDTFTAVYPYNHVYESEGGHIKEYDDTPDAMRIHERHASGSGYEIANDGSKVTKVQGDDYSITKGSNYVHVVGNSNTTVDGGIRVLVNKDRGANNYNIQVGEGAHVTIQVDKGDINLISLSDEGDINMKAGGKIRMEAEAGIYVKSALFTADIGTGGWTEIVDGTNTKTGTINTWSGNQLSLLNPAGPTVVKGSTINLN